jgi:hypothetical protein
MERKTVDYLDFNHLFLDQMLQVPGAKDAFDFANFHYYNGFRWGWEGPGPFNQDMLAKVNAITSTLAARGADLARKGVISSEASTFREHMADPDAPSSYDYQARYAPQSLIRGLAARLRAMFWFCDIDNPDGSSMLGGLLSSSLTPNPSYTSFQVATQQLSGLLFDQQLTFNLPNQATIDPYVQAYRFANGSIVRLALFTDKPGSRCTGCGGVRWEKIATDFPDGVFIDYTPTVSLTPAHLGGSWTGRVKRTDGMTGQVTFLGLIGATSVGVPLSSKVAYFEVAP